MANCMAKGSPFTRKKNGKHMVLEMKGKNMEKNIGKIQNLEFFIHNTYNSKLLVCSVPLIKFLFFDAFSTCFYLRRQLAAGQVMG